MASAKQETWRTGGGSTDAAEQRIGILLLHSQLNLYLAMGARLSEQGAKVFYYTRTEKERRAVLARLGIADPESPIVAVADLIPDGVVEPVADRDALVTRAREIEARIGETLHRVALAHRHLGAGFSPGSFSYPRDRRISGADYWHYLGAITEQVAFWLNEIAGKRLTAIVDGGKEAAVACRASGIAFRWLIFARYKDHRAWAVDEFQSLPAVASIFEQIADEEVTPATPEQYAGATQKIGDFWRRQRLPSLMARVLRNLTLNLAREVVRRRFSAVSWRGLVGYPIATYRASQAIRRRSTATVESLTGTPYVYLPLQKEPEQALLMAAPEHTDQLSVVIDVARALPAGVLLAISEHPYGIGRRAPAFYDQLAALPNVVFFSFEESPLARIANALVTVTISGTAAFEAATMGRPAIVFNPRSVPTLLPTVRTVGVDGTLEAMIGDLLHNGYDEDRARIDGAKFEEALRRASFSLGAYGTQTSEKSGTSPDKEHVATVTDALLASLVDYPAEAASE